MTRQSTIFSIIILTKNRPNLLKKCLLSIVNNCSLKNTEIILVNNDKMQSSNNFKKIAPKGLKFRVVNTFGVSKGKARNMAIIKARGQYIYFLDDDVQLYQNNIKILEKDFKSGAQVVGGPNLTPPKSSFFAKCNGEVLSSPFGSGPMFKRYKIITNNHFQACQKSLILCNLAVKRDIFIKNKILFDENIPCNEENLFIWQVERLGFKIIFNPKLVVYHERKTGFKSSFLQVATYGAGRFWQTLKAPKSLVPAALAAPLFVLYLFLTPLAILSSFYLMPLVVYLILNLTFSIHLALKKRSLAMIPLLFLLFLTIHLGYGLGFLLGAFKKS